eukprot:gene26985-35690_t
MFSSPAAPSSPWIAARGVLPQSQGSASDGIDTVPPPPDKGATAFVLRTGFGSSQGALLQMIEFSYVLREGLRKREKTTHELLIKCVIIITSVVPRQFPMQMAMAVNMALMSLSKAGVFCTEPFRVPLAGKVSHCLFDKTGTLTTDQLVPVGIINCNAKHNSSTSTHPDLAAVESASNETAMILAACHSLVVVEEDEAQDGEDRAVNLVGDPIEVAAIRGIDWSWDGRRSAATPDGAFKRQQLAKAIAMQHLAALSRQPVQERLQTYDRDVSSLQRDIEQLSVKIQVSKKKATGNIYTEIQVLQRHHFSSALQRMSVVCKCHSRNRLGDYGASTDSDNVEDYYCLVKGSPEVIGSLLIAEDTPTWYSASYEAMARKGLRVLALAYKKVSGQDSPAEQPRQWVESNLRFGGFIAFECKIRADSEIVVRSLLQADHKVTMLTGDALLTSLHVAKEVGIVSSKKTSLVLQSDKNAPDSPPYWLPSEGGNLTSAIPLNPKEIPSLALRHNLLSTEETFISESNKENHVFMCGDGGNDVGALKQADVGLALLAGHANSNTSDDLKKSPNPAIASTSTGAPYPDAETEGASAEDALNLHEKKLKVRAGEYMAIFNMMKDQASKVKMAMQEENMRFMALHGQKDGDGLDGSGSTSIEKLPGDASVAAPFTSRIPSVRAVVDLIRQGSLFHPAIFLSTLGQAAIHIACMTLAVHWATEEVTEFFKKVKANEIDKASLCGEDDYMCQLQTYWTFMPNLLNSVVFLVETSQMISGMLENHPLFLSVFLCIAGVIVAAWEMVLALVISTIAGTFLWDRLCVFFFAPQVSRASMEEAKKLNDFYPILLSVGKIAAVLLLLGSGNLKAKEAAELSKT